METSKLRAQLKKYIREMDADELSFASMFVYNWTEGSWTPPPLTEEQIAEIKKRKEEIDRGEVQPISSDELWESIEDKYGVVREDLNEYKAKFQERDRQDLVNMLDELSRDHLIRLLVFIESRKTKPKTGWDDLPEEAKASILRGKADAEAGRYSDAFAYLRKHG